MWLTLSGGRFFFGPGGIFGYSKQDNWSSTYLFSAYGQYLTVKETPEEIDRMLGINNHAEYKG